MRKGDYRMLIRNLRLAKEKDDPMVRNSGKPGTLFKSRQTDFQKEGEKGTCGQKGN